jgi:hypothetical protein
MKTRILRVVKCGEVFSIKSEKSESGQLNKRNIVLKELGGKFENEYAVTLLGDLAKAELKEGDIIGATLRFQIREYNGQVFQDIVATEMFGLG